MIIGILQADSVLEAFQEAHGDYPDMFDQLLTSGLSGANSSVETRHYNVEYGNYPKCMDECDGYVITGSKKSVYDDEPWIHQLASYVQALHQARKKLVGICFGHQLIAHALGGQASPAAAGWGVGIHESNILAEKRFMQPAKSEIKLVVSHKDQVNKLPPGADLLASNDFCINSIYQIGEHILSIQGHPEFSPEYAQALIEMRKDILGENKFEAGLRSLQQSPDRQLVGQWIINFIASQ